MDNPSTPNYNRSGHRGNPNYFKSGSPYKSPQDRPLPLYGSPDFQPYNYSSPVGRGSPNFYDPKKHQQDRNTRYGNQSSHSPYDRWNRPNYGNQNRGWQNYRKNKKDDISAYVNKSMLEDPWAELEKKAEATPQTPSSNPLSESSSSVAETTNETVESSLQLDTDDGDASVNVSNTANSSSNVSNLTGASPDPPDEVV